jgi:hypothetical protein
MKRTPHPEQSAMAGAFLLALHDRVDRDHAGEIVLPTGVTGAVAVAQVLKALDRARRPIVGAEDPRRRRS